MGFKRSLETLRWKCTDLQDRLAAAVASACRNQVWDRLGERVLVMDQDEARGYLRARCLLLLAAQSESTLQQAGLGRYLAPPLARRAGELLEEMILRSISHTAVRASVPRKAA